MTPRRWPTIGRIRWWERLLGWKDVRCTTCGTIGGATTAEPWGQVIACQHCPESDWLRSLPRKPRA